MRRPPILVPPVATGLAVLALLLPPCLRGDSAPAPSPYRQGQPPVAAPPPPPVPAREPWDDLAATLHAAGDPRVAVFWNWRLTDDVATPYREVTKKSGSDLADDLETEDATEYGTDSSRIRERHQRSKSSAQEDRRTVAEKPGQRGQPAEREAWYLESTFLGYLGGAGVTLVDRTLITRLAGADERGPRPNGQAIETEALARYADLLLEVLATPDRSAPLGQTFRVTLREVKSGRLLSDFVTRADPPRAPGRYVATANGFERARPPVNGSDALRQLAREAAQSLTAALRPEAGREP